MAGSTNEIDKTTWWKWVLRGPGLLLILAGAWKLFVSNAAYGQGWSLAGIGLIMLVLSMLSDLKSFSISVLKVFSLHAEVRDVIREARDVTNELRSLSKILGGEILKLLIGGRRWGGHGDSREIYDRSEALLSHLKSVGLSDADLRDVQGKVKHWIVIDYCEVISSLADAKRRPDTNPIWNEFWGRWRESRERPSPNSLETWLRENSWLDKEIAEWIEDYRYFCETGEHRRPRCFRDHDDILRDAQQRRRDR